MNARIQQPHTAFPRQQRGAMLVLVVIAMASLLLMGALALDGSHMLLNKTRLQNAVDAAALSGAKTLSMVVGATGSASLTQTAALNTLSLNANATGNEELGRAITANPSGFATVELASSVYGPFSFPGPTNATFVRVTVNNYPLSSFFWGVFQALDNGNATGKAVAAVATAGPSASSGPCDLTPLLVCGDPAQNNPAAGMFWGFKFGDLQVLKTAAGNNSAIGPGNFQLLDFGSGGKTVREALAGGINQCNIVGATAQTKPGNTVGPASQGLNTRFNEYKGGLSASDNVLSESVRRGARLAAVCNIQDPIILRRAMFNTAGNTGPSSLIASLTSANLNLIYLDANGAVVSSPNDLVGASGFAAIRYVQLQVTNFSFNLLIPGFRGVFILPTFRSTVPRESLGRQPDPAVTPGITPC